MFERKPRSDKLADSTVDLVKDFFLRDDNSSMTPGKETKLIHIVMVFLGHVYYNTDLEQDWTHCGFYDVRKVTIYQLLEILKIAATFRTVCLMF